MNLTSASSLSITAIITIVASLCGIIITILLIMGTVSGGNLKEKIYRIFFAMLVCDFLGNICEIVTSFLYGKSGEMVAIIIRIVDFVNYSIGSFILMVFSFYIYEYLSLKMAVPKKLFILAAVLSAFNIPIAAFSLESQIFMQLDSSNYIHITGVFWTTQVLYVLSLITLIIASVPHLKRLEMKVWMSMVSYLIIQVICYIIENYFPGVWVSYFGSAICGFILYVNIQVELKQRVNEQELELSEKRIAIMLSQIQPHFLYNTLNTIKALTATNPEKAQMMIGDFSLYLRQNMDSLKQTKLMPFEKELEHIKLYLEIEKQRFAKRLNVEYNLQTTDFTLPVLTIQPLVENAVRHGITKRREGGTVIISTRKLADKIQIIVADNGIGFDQTVTKQDGQSHIGMDNVKQRLITQCGGTLTVESEPEHGTVCTITIPQEDKKI